MEFQNILERKQINRLFNFFLPVDVCCCGCSLYCAVQTIIILQAITTVFYLIQVIFESYVPGMLMGICLAVLVYNGQKGISTKKNFLIYLWMMKILFVIGLIFVICVLIVFFILLCIPQMQNTSDGILTFIGIGAYLIISLLIQLYCLILIHSYYVKNYENEQISTIDTTAYPNQYLAYNLQQQPYPAIMLPQLNQQNYQTPGVPTNYPMYYNQQPQMQQ